MSAGTIALIVVAVSIAAWGAFMANVTIRRQRRALGSTGKEARKHPAATGTIDAGESGPTKESSKTTPEVTVQKVPPAQRKPLTPGQLAVSRRQFLNRAWTATFVGFLGFFGMATLSFLWPKLTGGFGTKIKAGNYDELVKKVGPDGNFVPQYFAEGRFYIVYYDGTGDAAVYLATNAKKYKMQALYRKCVHLGCSPPWCSTSSLFECPCHGSKYRLTGEYFSGPAPRGLDRFPITVEGGDVVVDTGNLQTGPPRGTDTWSKFSEPIGSFCIPLV
ncbi:MAG: ubiquinol-cytochrome c reductase iron-sulfur subunit [Actinomycetota bacterium]|nr:ubiquinol-cytochrome c reductase iron-sulfur subunit [Actinomycetota bacterium]